MGGRPVQNSNKVEVYLWLPTYDLYLDSIAAADFRIFGAGISSWCRCWITEGLLWFIRRIASGIVHRFVWRILQGRRRGIVQRFGLLGADPALFRHH